jgi:isocitrate dehydrogenase
MQQAPTKSPSRVAVAVAHGDGIGPEIMDATLEVIKAAGAELELLPVEIGEKAYLAGFDTGMPPQTLEVLRDTRLFLKAPITTPQGGGYKSLNVTTRKLFNLYANVRPAVAYAPFIPTKHPGMDVVIVRENEEDLYAGIEHRQTDEVYQCLKLITRPGCERIVRYAFEYARRNGRRKVTCFSKDNIMKFTDGLFHRVYDEIGAQYPDIEKEHYIVDIGAAKLADTPQAFDVIVMPNLYGDILSDVAAQIAGSVGLAASANIGDRFAMFEAIHGSAPRRAGQDVANPSGLLLSAVMMLVHVGQTEIAARVHNAWLATMEQGVHTYDLHPAAPVGTRAFAQAVVKNLGQLPQTLPVVRYESADVAPLATASTHVPEVRQLVGVDVFLQCSDRNPTTLGERLSAVPTSALKLKLISNRGIKVWPQGMPDIFCTDHWRCRYEPVDSSTVPTTLDIARLLEQLHNTGFDVIKTENLYTFDGRPGYTAAHG